jgi:hypothetical protein
MCGNTPEPDKDQRMPRLLLDKENSSTIGFVVSCAFAGAIDRQELQAWADHVLVAADSYPLYIVDLSTFDEPLSHIFRVIGFVPRSGLSDTEEDALIGITYMRGRQPFEPTPTREEALAALAGHSHVLARFRETFPFIPCPMKSAPKAALYQIAARRSRGELKRLA